MACLEYEHHYHISQYLTVSTHKRHLLLLVI